MISNSQNVNTGEINAGGDVLLGGQKVTNIYYSVQYKDLQGRHDQLSKQINDLQAEAKKNPGIAYFQKQLFETEAERLDLSKKIADFKKEVLKLAEEFSRIPINTERLKFAQQYFYEGDFDKARAVLDVESMNDELEELLDKKTQLESESVENENRLSDKANEFFILANLTAMDHTLDNRYELAVNYFEKAIKAKRLSDILVGYAEFLNNHQQITKAQILFEEVLSEYRTINDGSVLYKEKLGDVLKSLSIIYWDMNDTDKAEIFAREALTISEGLAHQEDKQTLFSLANARNALANILKVQLNFEEAEKLHDFALETYLELVKLDPDSDEYLRKACIGLHNKAQNFENKGEYGTAEGLYMQAIDICLELEKRRSEPYLHLVGTVQGSLANLYYQNNLLTDAKTLLDRNLEIYKLLVELNPYIFSLQLAITLTRLGQVSASGGNLPGSKILFEEAIQIFRKLIENEPGNATYYQYLAVALGGVGDTYLDDDPDKTLPFYEEALAINRKWITHSAPGYSSDLINCMNALAILYTGLKRWDEAEALYQESLLMIENLSEQSPGFFLADLAECLGNMGGFYSMKKKFPEAETMFQRALNIRRTLVEENPQLYSCGLAAIAINFSVFYLTQLPDKEKSISLAQEAWTHAIEFKDITDSANKSLERARQIAEKWGEDPNMIFNIQVE